MEARDEGIRSSELVEALARVPLFEGLPEEALRALAARAHRRRFPRNAVVMAEGEEGSTLYVLLEGAVKVYTSDEEGREAVLRIEGPGACLGELGLVDPAPRSASVMTLEPSAFLLISHAALTECLADSPEFASGLLRTLARRVRELTEQVRTLALLDVYGRLARTLEALATAEAPDGGRLLPRRFTHQELAAMVGASREMVSRVLRDLVQGGYVSVTEGGRLCLRRALPRSWGPGGGGARGGEPVRA